MPASGGDATQMTTDQGADYDVAWSPDGSQIVFTSNRAGSPDIWRMPVGGGVATALTSGPGNDFQPRWSPDGAWVAFQSIRDDQSDVLGGISCGWPPPARHQ